MRECLKIIYSTKKKPHPKGCGLDKRNLFVKDLFAELAFALGDNHGSHGITGDIVSAMGEGKNAVDILTMDDDAIEAVGVAVGNELMNFLMQAVEEVLELGMFFGE